MFRSNSNAEQKKWQARSSENSFEGGSEAMIHNRQGHKAYGQENIPSSSSDGQGCEAEEGDIFVVGQYNLSVCPICLEHFTIHNPAIIVHCEHSFHLQCLESWRQRSLVCPVCTQLLANDEGRLMEARDTRRRRRFHGMFSKNTSDIPSVHKKLYEDMDMVENISNSALVKEADIYSTFLSYPSVCDEESNLTQQLNQTSIWRWVTDWCSRF